MDRTIDHHDSQRPRRNNAVLNRVGKWRDAWTACHFIAEGYTSKNLKSFHMVLSQWIPVINWIFGNPIDNLDQTVPLFYYCNEPHGPKEILQFYMEPDLRENGERYMHIIFNLYEFNAIRNNYCDNMSRHNHMLVDEARGTINFSVMDDEQGVHNPAEYFKHMTTWQLLFVYTMHFLAHWDIYERYHHANYDTHLRLKESDFYNLFYFGKLVFN